MLRKRGMTLTEVLMTLTLMALVVLSGVSLSRGSLAAAHTRSAADLAAQVLRTARDTALAEGEVVSVSFPSNGGVAPVSLSAARRVGDHRPRLTEVFRLDRDFPDATFFAGWWTHPSATLDPPLLGDLSDSLNVAGLGLPAPQDPTLIFCPNGSVRSNGWVRVDSCYQLVVTNGATWAVDAPGGAPGSALCCRLTAASRPHVVSVSPLGEIRVSAGLPLATDVAIGEGPLPRTNLAPVPTVAGPPASGPTISRVAFTPSMERLTLPAGVDVLITADSYVGLKVEADSPEGCPLYCRWTVNAGDGGVSSPGEERMRWNGTAWTSSWSWRPPLTTANSLQYRLTCEVRDSYGNVAPAVAGSQVDAEVTYNKPKVAFATDTGFYAVNEDASGLRQLGTATVAVPARHIQYSPDGKRLAFTRGFSPPVFGELCLADADGDSVQVIATNLLQLSAACSWNPAGTQIAWMAAGTGGQGDLFIANADGSGLRNLTSSAQHESYGSPGHGTLQLPWREVGAELEILTTGGAGQQHALLVNATSGAVRDLTPALAARYPVLSPDSAWVAFISGSGVYKVPADGSAGPVQLTGAQGPISGAPCFSPDSQWVYYLREVAWDPYGGQFELRRIKLDDSGDMRVIGGRGMTMMKFFPGTTTAAFVCPDPPSNDNLIAIGADGSGPRLLTNHQPYKWMQGVWGGVP